MLLVYLRFSYDFFLLTDKVCNPSLTDILLPKNTTGTTPDPSDSSAGFDYTSIIGLVIFIFCVLYARWERMHFRLKIELKQFMRFESFDGFSSSLKEYFDLNCLEYWLCENWLDDGVVLVKCMVFYCSCPQSPTASVAVLRWTKWPWVQPRVRRPSWTLDLVSAATVCPPAWRMPLMCCWLCVTVN